MEEITLQKLVDDWIEAKKHERWYSTCITGAEADKFKLGYSNYSRDIVFWKYIRKAVYRYAFVLAYEEKYEDTKALKNAILKERNKIKVRKYFMLDKNTELAVLIELLTKYLFNIGTCYGTDNSHHHRDRILEAVSEWDYHDLHIAKNVDRFADWELHERDYTLSVRVSAIVETIVDNDDQ